MIILKIRQACIYATLVVIFCIIIVYSKYEEIKVENKYKKYKQDLVLNFESNKNIKLYRSSNCQIEEINLNNYLLSVIASEMPFKYEFEALKAQTIVARTYLYNKIQNNLEEQGDVCDNYAHCQAFTDLDKLYEIWHQKGYSDMEIEEGINKIKEAILETDGLVITYNGELIDALFHASSPGKTEDASAIWFHVEIPYLVSVENVEDEDYERRESEVNISFSNFKDKLKEKGYIDNLTEEEFKNIKINSYTKSGRVNDILVGKYYISAENLRSIFGLNSTNFTLDINDDKIHFHVIGFGHGVGMSQVGANTYARKGANYEKIINHYYAGVEIINVNK